MSILTGIEIKKQVAEGRISIDDFDETRVNPNSYNLLFDAESLLKISPGIVLDCAVDSSTYVVRVDEGDVERNEDGTIYRVKLHRNMLYLACTIEKTSTDHYVPMLTGRSSLARLGISIHQTAGFGDIGFNGKWTLEISCTNDTWLYHKAPIAQIYYLTPCGDYEKRYDGKYQNNNSVQTSKLYQELQTTGEENATNGKEQESDR